MRQKRSAAFLFRKLRETAILVLISETDHVMKRFQDISVVTLRVKVTGWGLGKSVVIRAETDTDR